jgi:hypothetical protein
MTNSFRKEEGSNEKKEGNIWNLVFSAIDINGLLSEDC